MIVYLVTNNKNGMQYVGQTSCTLKRRWANHCPTTDHNPYFTNAIRKYGREEFSVIVIQVCESKEEMDFVETFYISLLNTKRPNGYNLTDGGEGCPGHTVSAEGRLRMRNSHLGKKQSEETKKRKAESLCKAYAEGRRTGFAKNSEPWNKSLTGTFRHTEEAKKGNYIHDSLTLSEQSD
jgi:group I intron endonuclease